MCKYKLVVWDWDGTIMDTTAVIVNSIKYACEKMGIEPPADEICASVIGLGWNEAIRTAVPACPEKDLKEFSRYYQEYYLPHEADVTLFPGIRKLLFDLKNQGVKLAVATGKSRRGLNAALKATKLTELFDSTQTVTENASKPNPEMLEQIEIETGIGPKDTVMVGDTTHDLYMANAFGCAAIGVTTGAHPVSELAKANPLKICHTLVELRIALGLSEQ